MKEIEAESPTQRCRQAFGTAGTSPVFFRSFFSLLTKNWAFFVSLSLPVTPTHPLSRLRQVKPNMVRSAISKLKSQGVLPEFMSQSVESKGLIGAALKHAKRMAEIYSTYQRRLVQSNALDFDDIILVALRLLRQDSGEALDVSDRVFLFLFAPSSICRVLVFGAAAQALPFWVTLVCKPNLPPSPAHSSCFSWNTSTAFPSRRSWIDGLFQS